MKTLVTNTLAERQRAGIAAHALISLGLHLSRHVANLAAPRGQRLPGPGVNDHLTVELYSADIDAWAVTINVSGDTLTFDEDGSAVRRVDGLLPDSGLRVQLVATYPALQAVSA